MNVLDQRKRIGNCGEQFATDELTSIGYHLIARNWRDRSGELDVVVCSSIESLIIFVEVRTRVFHGQRSQHPLASNEEMLGWALESVDAKKQRQIRQLAKRFLHAHPAFLSYNVRFDVIAVLIDSELRQLIALNRVESAF